MTEPLRSNLLFVRHERAGRAGIILAGCFALVLIAATNSCNDDFVRLTQSANCAEFWIWRYQSMLTGALAFSIAIITARVLIAQMGELKFQNAAIAVERIQNSIQDLHNLGNEFDKLEEQIARLITISCEISNYSHNKAIAETHWSDFVRASRDVNRFKFNEFAIFALSPESIESIEQFLSTQAELKELVRGISNPGTSHPYDAHAVDQAAQQWLSICELLLKSVNDIQNAIQGSMATASVLALQLHGRVMRPSALPDSFRRI